MELGDVLQRVKFILDEFHKHEDANSRMLACVEELGELGEALRIQQGLIPHKEADEGPRAEAADLLITALAMFATLGGTGDDLEDCVDRKLVKWVRTKRAASENGFYDPLPGAFKYV